jgi:hypothetical protein
MVPAKRVHYVDANSVFIASLKAAVLCEKSSPSLRKDSNDAGLAAGEKKKNRRKISNWFVKVCAALAYAVRAITNWFSTPIPMFLSTTVFSDSRSEVQNQYRFSGQLLLVPWPFILFLRV